MVTDTTGLPRAKAIWKPPLSKKRSKIEGCSKVMGSNRKPFEEFRRRNQNVFQCKTNQGTKKAWKLENNQGTCKQKEKETVVGIA